MLQTAIPIFETTRKTMDLLFYCGVIGGIKFFEFGIKSGLVVIPFSEVVRFYSIL